jgi:hypothetical protein
VDGRFWPREFDDLLEEPAADEFARRRGADVEPNAQGDETITPVVGNPERLDSGVIVYVSEHVRVFFGSVDELECGQDVLGDNGEELEHGTIPPPDDDAIIDKCQRGRDVIAANAVSPERHLVVDVPQSESGVLGNSSQREMRNIEIKRDQALLQSIRIHQEIIKRQDLPMAQKILEKYGSIQLVAKALL